MCEASSPATLHCLLLSAGRFQSKPAQQQCTALGVTLASHTPTHGTCLSGG